MIKRGERKFSILGLSTIVATLIIILLVLALIALFWFGIGKFIKQNSELIDLGKITLDLSIEKIQFSGNDVSVTVKRNQGEGEFVGISFVFEDGENSEEFIEDVSMNELDVQTFDFILSQIDVKDIEKIKIVPIFRLKSGKEVLGPIKDTWEKDSSEVSQCTPNCLNKECGSDGCLGSCGTCGTGQTCSLGVCVNENTCADTCASLNYQCGTVCGVDCGSCTNAHGTTSCSTGICQPVCDANYSNCDLNAVNGCETQLGTTTDCAFCGNACSTGQTCTVGVCITPCTDTCNSLSYTCGIQTICGGEILCGVCSSGFTCQVSNGTCMRNPCIPNCAGKNCGIDGCGGSCGICSTGYNCQTNGTCTRTCIDTCFSLGYTCGTHIVCGVNTNCGICQSGYTCQISNSTCMKTCTPTTCFILGRNCGSVSDNCGGTLNCGTCSTGYTCQTNGTCMRISSGNIYYVATNGNDNSGTGSISNPWRSLYRACQQVTIFGSIIHINTGIYTETQQCVLSVGVSIEGEGSDRSTIKSTIADRPTIVLESSSVTNGNQSISYIKLDGNGLTAYAPITIKKRSNVEIHHNIIVDFYEQGVSFYGESGFPINFCINNRFHDNIITNCASFDSMGSPGNLQVNAQQGMRIYSNVITQTARGENADGFGLKCVEGYNKDMKIYNNTITVDYDDERSGSWTFAMEFWNSLGGIEIYNNRIQGVIDLAGHFGRKGVYDYSYSVHENIIGHDYLKSAPRHGMYLENTNDLSDILVYNNLFKNLKSPILFYTLSTSRFSNIIFSYNIFYNIGMNSPGWWGYGFSEGGESGYTLTNLKFLNNIFIPASVSGMYPLAAIQIPSKGTINNVDIQNNIIANFDYATVCTSDVGTGTINDVSIENNIFYNNDATIKWVSVIPNNVVQNKNIFSNPLFVSNSNFHLQSNSPAINAGINVGLTRDYNNNAILGLPDIGAFESNY